MDCNCHKKSYANCIDIVPIFSNLTCEEKMEVASITTAQTFEKGDMIYRAGDKSDKLYVLHTGRVKISRFSINGKEQVIRVVEPGEFMGELSLFSSLPMTDNAEALETSTMCVIEGARLKELMKKYPAISFKVMEELSQRLERAESLIEKINLSSVEQRLAEALLTMSAGKNEVVLNVTKGVFASQIGMTQETLSRKLASFQEERLIQLKGHRKIIILDRDGLEKIISGLHDFA
ncbi:MAG TPA: Crp/Fnr family transcriptional regulator [Clostridiaceae bacterium]|nr:Crp/Fnr family transcriptional regulator [Clostridiaceae bacterium]